MFCLFQGTFWTQASQVLRHPARLRILLIKRRQHMPIGCYLPGKYESAGNKSQRGCPQAPSFLCNCRQRWTSDSLCSVGKTSTLPPPTKTWPTLPTCTSTALGNLTTHCEYRPNPEWRALVQLISVIISGLFHPDLSPGMEWSASLGFGEQAVVGFPDSMQNVP